MGAHRANIGVPVRSVISTPVADNGEVVRVIHGATRNAAADLVVLGSHAHARVWGIAMQSVGGFFAHEGANALILEG